MNWSIPCGAALLELCLCAAATAGGPEATGLFHETYRPQFHYTAAKGWINDPTGLVFYEGRYHLFNDHNPVLKQLVGDNRDPKVFWHEPSDKWVMALFLRGNDYALFGSPDLKRWGKLSELKLPGARECPDLFELPILDARGRPIRSKKGGRRWIFWGANGTYLIGRFDRPAVAPAELTAGRIAHPAERDEMRLECRRPARLLRPPGPVSQHRALCRFDDVHTPAWPPVYRPALVGGRFAGARFNGPVQVDAREKPSPFGIARPGVEVILARGGRAGKCKQRQEGHVNSLGHNRAPGRVELHGRHAASQAVQSSQPDTHFGSSPSPVFSPFSSQLRLNRATVEPPFGPPSKWR